MGGKRTLQAPRLKIIKSKMSSLRVAFIMTLLLLSGCGENNYGAGLCRNTLSGWRQPGEIGHQVRAFFITVERDRITSRLWDAISIEEHIVRQGRPVNRSDLSQILDSAAEMQPTPMVILQPFSSADCDLVRNIRAEMNRKLDCRRWQCGEGRGWYEFEGLPRAD